MDRIEEFFLLTQNTVTPGPSYSVTLFPPSGTIWTGLNYAFSAVTDVPSPVYNWSVGPGATIVSGQGTDIVSISFTSAGSQTVSLSVTGGGSASATWTGTVTAFSPMAFGGLVAWLDFADLSSLTLDGSNLIGQALNKTGNGLNAVQTNTTAKPTWFSNQLNGLGAARGNGSNQWLEIGSFPALDAGYTIYAVSQSSGAANAAIFSLNPGVFNGAAVIGNDAGSGSYVSQWGAAVAQPAPAAGTDFARMVKFDGVDGAGGYRIRLSTRTSDTTGSMPTSGGAPPSGTAFILRAVTTYSARNLYELFIYNRQTTVGEDVFLKSYITAKWGLTWA